VIRERTERARIEAIAVPPAYESVWISPEPLGHLQATGRDARNRKQYIYHKDWQELRDHRKYDRLAEFGRTLPRLRSSIASGLRAPAGSRQLALAAVLALIDRAALRIGSSSYARDNKSYGATTLLRRHLRFGDECVTLSFPSKGSLPTKVRLRGSRLQRALHRVRDLPGAELFTWQDEDGCCHCLRSEEVNEALQRICGDGVSAKTFRTWNGTHAAFSVAVAEAGDLKIADMAAAAADRLNNTPTVARKSYIHPQVAALAEIDPGERRRILDALETLEMYGLRAQEGNLITFLEQCGGGK